VRPGAIVLAGGASSRFGGDKLAAELGGRPILQHTVEAVDAAASPVVLVLAPDAPIPAWAAAVGRSPVIARDAETYGGPLVGLAAGLAALHEAAPDVATALVVGGDMPALVPAVLELLAATLEADPALGAVTLAADPPAILPLAVRVAAAVAATAAILGGQGKRSLRALLAAVPSAVVPEAEWRALDSAAATLRDIDTPADLS
jgi:molybdopterin-guanine dinucleotide biosynthesis protein A